MSNFIHLHLHNDYSLLDGAMKIEDILEKCKKHDMKSVAVTNHGNLFNMLDMMETGKKEGIKVIPGIETYMTWDFPLYCKDGKQHDQRYHLILLAMNETGYKNLMKLSSIAFIDGFYHKPRIDFDTLAKHQEGLIVLSACLGGIVAKTILNHRVKDPNVCEVKKKPKKEENSCDHDDQDPFLRDENGKYLIDDQSKLEEDVDKVINLFKEVFGDRYYLEIQYHVKSEFGEGQQFVNEQIFKAAERTNTKVVATADSHYVDEDKFEAWQTMMELQTNKAFGKSLSNENWMKSFEELQGKVPDETLYESGRIADRCEEIKIKKSYKFPHIDLGGRTADEALEEDVTVGLLQRFKEEGIKDKETILQYKERAIEEVGILNRMGFGSYMLIVADYVKWAKDNNILVGPARGSAAGSLVCWALRITEVDPIKYGLLFERFINPERVSMPDIDVDFEDSKRDRVKEYLINKYGSDKVANITTFGTMAAKGALRDVARMQGVSYIKSDLLAKAVPDGKRGKNVYLKEAIEDKEFAALIKNDSEYKKVYEIASVLEGMVRNTGTHAAGVVISDSSPLVTWTPLHKDKDGQIVTQYDMNVLESIGLIKLDLLGLSTLTVIGDTLKAIEENHNKVINIDKIPTDDDQAFDILCRGDLTGVFQLGGSDGFRDLTMKIQPRNIDEIADTTSIYRPGPLDNGFDKTYVENKHSGNYSPQVHIESKKEIVDGILKPTKGVIIYQEQVMQLARDLAGYSLGQADLLRRAMGKKKPEEMEEQKKTFIDGCLKNGITKDEADVVFEVLAKFAEYGFNKSHAIAYSLITYQTAWLKAHYPVEFMAANLSDNMQKIEDLLPIILNCKDNNIEVLPPDVNKSDFKYKSEGDKIRFGLGGIRGLGETVVQEIIDSRNKHKGYFSLFDFCNKVNLRRVNKKSLEALIKSGCFNSILKTS